MTRCTALILLLLAATAGAFDTTYRAYDAFLARYVCPQGVVYSTIAGDTLQDAAARNFEQLPQKEFDALSTSDQIAFLINAYNFFTIQLVGRNYPLKNGIRDLPKPWDTKFINVLGQKVSLNQIEHEWLRKKYQEPRIHFTLNCASKSCPPLRLSAYTGGDLPSELDQAAKTFLNDTTRNRPAGDKLLLSSIFDWYGGDFKRTYGSYQKYVMGVLGLQGDYRVKFIDYDWRLNDAPPCSGKQGGDE